MAKKNGKFEAKSLNSPEEVRDFENGKVELVNVGGAMIGRAVFQPGWKWSESVKPLVGTDSCKAPHFQYHVSGTLRVRMDDGTEKDLRAGDVSLLGAGHDAWVIGDEPVMLIDFQGMKEYARKAAAKPKKAGKETRSRRTLSKTRRGIRRSL